MFVYRAPLSVTSRRHRFVEVSWAEFQPPPANQHHPLFISHNAGRQKKAKAQDDYKENDVKPTLSGGDIEDVGEGEPSCPTSKQLPKGLLVLQMLYLKRMKM